MKKIKFIFMISFVCLLSVLGIYTLITGKTFVSATSENEKPKLEIYKNNVSYSSEIFLAYAVTYENMDAKDYEVQLLFWTELKDEYVKGTESYVAVPKNYQTIDKKKCIVFYSYGLAAKQMTEDIYTRAYVKIGNQEYYSEVDKFSILDYAHRMLEGGTLNPHQEKLLKNLLNYGGAAQDNFGHNTDKPADATYYEIKVNSGKLPDGFDHGRYQYGEKLIIKPNQINGYKFSHWTDELGIIVSYDEEFEISIITSKEYTANYKDITSVATQLQMQSVIAYDDSLNKVDFPTYVSFEYNGEQVTLKVLWDTSSFKENTIGFQKFYATLEDESAYEKYGIGQEDIYMEVITSAYTYELDQTTGLYIITGYYGNEETVNVPSVYNNVMISTIASKAFYENLNIKQINIPSTITKIAKGAIWYCDNIESIQIPFTGESLDSNNSWLGYIFGAADYQSHTSYLPLKLTKVSLPEGATEIANYAFYECAQLKEIYIPKTLETIGREAFSGCTALTEFKINSQLKRIGGEAFEDCINLKKVYVDSFDVLFNIEIAYNGGSNSVGHSPLSNDAELYVNNQLVTEVTIPSFVSKVPAILQGCSTITKITIPNTVTSLQSHYGVFRDMKNLETVVFEGNSKLIEISSYSFIGCRKLDEVYLPSGITQIGDAAFAGCYNLQTIVIPDAVTSIGEGAFEYCKSLRSLKLPNNLETIEYGAFQNCSSLEYIEIPNGVTKINKSVFYDCEKLMEVELPESLVLIDTYAFNGCRNLRTITIPSRCRDIENSAFSGCSRLYEINNKSSVLVFEIGSSDYGNIAYYALKVDNNGTISYKDDATIYEYIETEDGLVFLNYEGEYYLISYKGNEEVPTIPLTIEGQPFSTKYMDNTLKHIRLSSDYVVVSQKLFTSCCYLESVIIPEGVTEIEYNAFSNCSSMKQIELPKSLKSIGNNAFAGCESLTEITIPEGVTKLEYSIFSECISLEKVVLPTTITSLGDYLFRGCESLTEITIPKGVELIGHYAFNGCTSLATLFVPNTIIDFGDSPFEGVEKVYIDLTLEELLSKSFNMINIGDIYIKDSNDEYYLFESSEFIQNNSVYISSEVKKIGYNVFEDMENIDKVYYDGTLEQWLSIYFASSYSNPMYYANELYLKDSNDEYYLYENNDVQIIIPEGVKQLNSYLFYGIDNFSKVIIGSTVEEIDWNCFDNCPNVKEIIDYTGDQHYFNIELDNYYLYEIIDEENVKFIYHNGVTKELSLLSEVNGIPVTSIVQYAFSNSDINKITIPENVKVIEEYAFSDTFSLTYVSLPSSLEEVKENAFRCLPSNALYYYQGTVEQWLEINFEDQYANPMYTYNVFVKDSENKNVRLYNITDIEIPSGVTKIGDYALSYVNNLHNITIPASVTTVGTEAFFDCDSLVNVYYDGTLEQWLEINFESVSSNPLYRASNFYIKNENGEYVKPTELVIPNTIKTLKRSIFVGFTTIESLVLPNSVTEIEENALFDLTSLKDITLPNTIKTIGFDAFGNCKSLENVYFDGSIEQWFQIEFGYGESNPLYRASNFYIKDENGEYVKPTELVIPETVTNINQALFVGFTNTEKVVIPSSVATIEYSAFSQFTNLKEITIPASVKTIQEYAFENCELLEKVYYEGTLEQWFQIEFANDLSNPMNYAENLYLIDENGEFIQQTEFVIPNNIDRLTRSMILGFNFIESVTIPNTIKYLDYSAFVDCTLLTNVYFDGTLEEWFNIIVYSVAASPFQYASHFFVKKDGAFVEIKDLVIPESITKVESTTFAGYQYFDTITIHDGVTFIGANSFGGENTKVYCEAEKTPISWNAEWYGNISESNIYWGVTGELTISNKGYGFVGEEIEISIINYSNYQDAEYIISVDNEDVATVLENGVIALLSEGTFEITVRIEDTDIVTTKTIYVIDKSENIIYVDEVNVTFEQALKEATEGTTIYLLPGKYEGTYNIDINNISIICLNANINPNTDVRKPEAILLGTVNINANNININGLCISEFAKINGYSTENTVLNNILIKGSLHNTNSYTNLNFYEGTKNLTFINSRIEQTKRVRQMIIYLCDVDGLTIQNCEFYGPSYEFNDGIKIVKSYFGIKGNVTISNNILDGYQQYPIWFRYYAEGTYIIENNIIKNCGKTVASHAAVTFVEYTGNYNGLVNVKFNKNIISNVPMMFRIDAANNAVMNFVANYNIVENWYDGYIQYVKVSSGPIVNAEYNYWGTENVDESLFNGIAVPENIYTSIEEVQ